MIHLVLQSLPPSSNHAYVNMRGGGGRILSTVGKKYKNETKTALAQHYMSALAGMEKNAGYLVYMRFHFSDIFNSTYGKPKGAESRYKKFDASNRAKLLEDVIKDVTGVDDSNTMTLILEKRLATGPDATEVFLWNLDKEESPFDAILHRF